MEACVLITKGAVVARTDWYDSAPPQEVIEYDFVTVAVRLMEGSTHCPEIWAFKRDGHSYITLGRNVRRSSSLGVGDES
jgi:hypothetical protein